MTLPLGFAFWWLAARNFSPDAVGLASAAVSAMMLLATVSLLGFGTLLIGELARDRADRMALVRTSLAVVGGMGLVVGTLFAVVAPLLSRNLGPLGADPLVVLLFAAGVSLTAMTQVLDQALIGLLRGSLQLWRNLVLGVSKLALVGVAVLLPLTGGVVIYGTWVAGICLSLAVVAFLLPASCFDRTDWRPRWKVVRELRGAASWHHALNLGLAGPQFALPVVATVTLSPREGAYFYVAWIVGTVPSIAPGALATMLYAVGAADREILQRRVTQTLRYSFVLLVVVGVPVVLVAPWALRLFGADYAAESTTALRLIVLGGLPLAIRSHFVAVSRALGSLRRAVMFVSVTGVLEVTGAVLGAMVGGLSGLALAVTIVLFLEAAIMLRPLYTLREAAARGAG